MENMNQIQLERSVIFVMIFGELDRKEILFSQCDPTYFTQAEARNAFISGLHLYNENKESVDLPLLIQRVDKATETYLYDVFNDQPLVTYDNLLNYIDALAKNKRLREFTAAATSAIEAAKAGDESAIYELSNRIEQIQDTGTQSEFITLEESVINAINHGSDISNSAIKTGYWLIDDYFDGIAPGRLALLAAETGAGKSAFAANLAWEVAKRGGVVLYLSLEMRDESISNRIIYNVTGVDKVSWHKAAVNQDDKTLARIAEAVDLVHRKQIVYRTKNNLTPQQLLNAIRQVKAGWGKCDLVIVDYLQLMQSNRRSDTREREVADFSRSLVTAALQEDTFILALSQVNRQVNGRSSNRLYLSDIRESAAPTQDASGVFMLYYDDDQDSSQDRTLMTLELAKNRGDRTGSESLIFDKPLQRFSEIFPT